MLAREDDGSAWGADGVGDEGSVEDHALVGDTVDVRGPIPVGTIGGNCLVGVIIGKEEQHVWTFGLGGEKSFGDLCYEDREEEGEDIFHGVEGWSRRWGRQGAK